MTSTYTSNLNIEKPATGDQVDQWGPTVNDNMDLIDTAVAANLSKAGGTMTGNLTMGANEIFLSDNGGIRLGDSEDLQIVHDGSDSIIKDHATGNLRLETNGNGVYLINSTDDEFVGKFLNGGAGYLYHDGNQKFETSATGATLTGNLVVSGTVDGRDVATDGSTLDATTTTANAALPKAGGTMTGNLLHEDSVSSKFGTGNDFSINFDGNYANLTSAGTEPIRVLTDNFIVMNRAGSYNVMNMPTANAGIDFSYNGTRKFGVESYGIDVVGNVQVSGTVDGVDIASRDGVLTSTTTTANAALARTGGSMTGQISFGDNVKANFGNSNDLEIYHDGNDSYIKDSAGTGDLLIQTNKLQIVKANALDTMAEFIGDGAVKLRYDDGLKFETTSSGVTISGTLTANALEGSLAYSSLTGTPTIPTNNNQLSNGNGYTTNTGTLTQVTSGGATTVSAGNGIGLNNGSGTITMSGSYSGSFSATGNITAYSSDERLKNFKGKIENALDKVERLSGYYYEWNDTAKNIDAEAFKEGLEVGVNAQEVEAIMPEVIATAPIVEIHNLDTDYKTVHYDKLVPLLIEAIKELKQEINSIKKCSCGTPTEYNGVKIDEVI